MKKRSFMLLAALLPPAADFSARTHTNPGSPLNFIRSNVYDILVQRAGAVSRENCGRDNGLFR